MSRHATEIEHYTNVQMMRTIPEEKTQWVETMVSNNAEISILGWYLFPSTNKYFNASRSSAMTDNNLAVTSLSPAEQIAFVRETLSLNMSQIAELIGVSRPTAYAWLDGRESERGETAGKIMRLAVMVQTIKEKNIPRVDLLVKRPIFERKSLLDLIKERKYDISCELDELKTIGSKEETARANNRIPKNKVDFSRLNEVIDEISAPVFFEEPLDQNA